MLFLTSNSYWPRSGSIHRMYQGGSSPLSKLSNSLEKRGAVNCHQPAFSADRGLVGSQQHPLF